MSDKSVSVPSVIGPCTILSRLGSGGMGTVYKAHHADLDLDVAVKLLHPHLVHQQALISRFLREARLAARLNLPGIVRVFGCGEHDGQFYIVMEFIDGSTLQHSIDVHGRIEAAQSLEIVATLARTLRDALIDCGVIHRDIKPDNVILAANGMVKLADLGLAKIPLELGQAVADGATVVGTALGTPRYMSPEQFVDATQVDHRADIYSLGATLYHMLSGKPPFDGTSIWSILKQIEESEPEPLPASVPSATREIVSRMISRTPDKRFQTYDELLDAIAGARDSISDRDTVTEGGARDLRAGYVIPGLKTSGRMLKPAAPTENRVLLVVDIQNDFCPGGALGVPEGDQVVPVINALARRFSHVILTQDWHCVDHLSFASSHPGKQAFNEIALPYGSQILWPDHCVQATGGAEFHRDLQIPHCELIVRKGYHREIDSYSAFFENDRMTPTGLAGYLRERGLTQLFIVGLATDFCVAYSALDARKLGFEVTVIEHACRGIDLEGSVDAAWQQMLDAGVVRA